MIMHVHLKIKLTYLLPLWGGGGVILANNVQDDRIGGKNVALSFQFWILK